MCNLGDEPQEFESAGQYRLLLASRADVCLADAKVVLPPNTLAIVSAEKS
jgi:hypothetical protein